MLTASCAGTTEQALAEYLAELSYAQTSVASRSAARRLLLDAVACMLAGLQSLDCHRIVQFGLWEQGVQQASVVGVARRQSAATAARLNAVLGHWWEWDDVHDPAGLHPGMVIWPVALATAESMEAVGAELHPNKVLVAAIAAYDVAVAYGSSFLGSIETGWMPTGIACTVAAAGAAARIRGLDIDGVLSAMAIAAAGVGLSRQALDDRVSAKNVLCALAVSRAMEAAELAAAGVKGAPNFSGGPFGIAALVGKRGEPFNVAGQIKVGEGVLTTSIKPFPSCRATHPAVDLALEIRPAIMGDLVPRSVTVKVPKPMAEMCGKPFAPIGEKRVAARFSIPYTTSVALCRGGLQLSDFKEDNIDTDSRVLELCSRVDVESYATPRGQSALGSPVQLTVTLSDGSVRTASQTVVKGAPAKPLSDGEMLSKLYASSGAALTTMQMQAVLQVVAALESRGIGDLMATLREARWAVGNEKRVQS